MTQPPPDDNEVELAVRLTPDTEHLAAVFRIVGEHLTAAGASFTACADRLSELVNDPAPEPVLVGQGLSGVIPGVRLVSIYVEPETAGDRFVGVPADLWDVASEALREHFGPAPDSTT